MPFSGAFKTSTPRRKRPRQAAGRGDPTEPRQAKTKETLYHPHFHI